MFKHLVALAILTAVLPAHAYFSTMDTGELVRPQAYRATLEPQFIFNRYDGANIIGRFATGIDDDSSAEITLGMGTVDFEAGAFYKLIPYPDADGQPAIGGKVGFLIGNVKDETEYNIRFHPLISKSFDTEIGTVTPYGSLPLGITIRNDDTFVPVQLAGGAEYKVSGHENLRLMAELGINVNKAFNYVSFAVAYNFDEENVDELRKRSSGRDDD